MWRVLLLDFLRCDYSAVRAIDRERCLGGLKHLPHLTCRASAYCLSVLLQEHRKDQRFVSASSLFCNVSDY